MIKHNFNRRRFLHAGSQACMAVGLAVAVVLGSLYFSWRSFRWQRTVIYQLRQVKADIQTEAGGPAWARWLIGEDYFVNVVKVELKGIRVDAELLSSLGSLPRLRELSLKDTSMTISQWEQLERSLPETALTFRKTMHGGDLVGEVNDVVFADNGSTLISAGTDKTVRKWDIESGDEIELVNQFPSSVSALAISPDGATFAVGQDDDQVVVWDLARRQAKLAFDPGITATNIEFLAQGSQIVVAGWGGLAIFDARTGDRLRSFGESRKVGAFSITADRRTIASADYHSRIQLWDIDSGAHKGEIGEFPGATPFGMLDTAIAVAFSPDGNTLAQTIAFERMSETYLWDVDSGRQNFVLKSPGMYAIAFNASGTRLVTAGSEMILWDTQSGKQVAVLEADNVGINSIRFSPDGRFLAGGSRDWFEYGHVAYQDVVRVWNVPRR